MDTVEIHASDMDYDIDGGSDYSAATDREIPTTDALSADHESCEYRPTSLPSSRSATSQHMAHIPF